MQTEANWIETDVLVIGSGGAGLQAALSARARDVDVLLISKTARDEPNCTVVTAGYLTYSTPQSADELFRQVVEVGGFLNNQQLVETFVRELPARMDALKTYGVELEVETGDDPTMPGYLKITKPGSERRGLAMTRPMRATAERLGVKFLDSTLCTSLRRGERGGWVVHAMDLSSATCVGVAAKAVVIATGGGAGAFERTDNPPGTTGDGIVLAFEAGAELVDLELVSFQFPRERLADLFRIETVPDPELLKKGAAHYFLGGIKINERAETSVPGLFAAGEATGGLFGAARLGGSAMGDIVVFGALAGEHAADYAACAEGPAIEELPVQSGWRRSGRIAPDTLAHRVRSHLWRYLGAMKDEAGLERARVALCAADEDWHKARVDSPEEFRVHLETRFGIKLGQLLTVASGQRRETRGCYWRMDYPDFDNDNCLHNVVLRRSGDGVAVETRPVVTTRTTQPTAPMVGAGCFGYLRK